MMKLAIFILLSSAIMVAATDQYQVQVVRTSPSSNILDNCKEPVLVLDVDFQTLTLKSGVTYQRRTVPETMADYIESTAVELGVGPDLLSCSKEASRTGHNTFMIRQGKCLGWSISVPELCHCSNEEVLYSTSDLSPDAKLPVSEVSNLTVSLKAELGKFNVTVEFDEGSLLPDLYFYQLEFDGRTEVVTSGSEIIVEELTSCCDLVFTLTPYICGNQWGSSAVYQLQIPVSEISNLKVSLKAALEMFNVTVEFDEGSLLPDLYSYRLEFDGRTEVVTSGSEIIVEELTSCFDLVFTLTPYIYDNQWGSSAVYQLQIHEIPSPEFDTEADAINSDPEILTINLKGLMKDPCHTVVGYTISLTVSNLREADQVLEFSGEETEIVLTCDQIRSFYWLGINAETVEGVERPEKFTMKTVVSGSGVRLYNSKHGVCFLIFPKTYYNSSRTTCESYGWKLMGRADIDRETVRLLTASWLPLEFSASAQMWQWDDGTFLPNDDPLWESRDGTPSDEWQQVCFSFDDHKVYLKDSREIFLAACYPKEDR